MKFEEFEKMIITDIFEQYPEYKKKLQAQFESSTVQKRERFAFGFSTAYAVTAVEQTLGEGKNLQLGGHQWNINGLNHGSDYILWIKNGLISSLEGFSYQEPWPDEILRCEKMRFYILSMQFSCDRPLGADLVPSHRKACIPAAQSGVYNTPSFMVNEEESLEDAIYDMCRTYEKVIEEVRSRRGTLHLYITHHAEDASELVIPNRLLRFLAEREISLGVD